LPQTLAQLRQRNAQRIDTIVARHADAHGWPHELARRYLGHILRFDLDHSALDAMGRFLELAAGLGLAEPGRPVVLYQPPPGH
jgi:hypothetical protein